MGLESSCCSFTVKGNLTVETLFWWNKPFIKLHTCTAWNNTNNAFAMSTYSNGNSTTLLFLYATELCFQLARILSVFESSLLNFCDLLLVLFYIFRSNYRFQFCCKRFCCYFLSSLSKLKVNNDNWFQSTYFLIQTRCII